MGLLVLVVFAGWMPFLSPNQQCQSTERIRILLQLLFIVAELWGEGFLQFTDIFTYSSAVVNSGEDCAIVTVCLYVCEQENSKSYGRIWIRFSGVQTIVPGQID